MLHSHDLQMSFSGLKTAVLTAVEKVCAETGSDEIPEQTRNDICRAFQDAVVDVLAAKAKKALLDTGFRTLVVAGGVGANWKLRDEFSRLTVKVPSEKANPSRRKKNQCLFPADGILHRQRRNDCLCRRDASCRASGCRCIQCQTALAAVGYCEAGLMY